MSSFRFVDLFAGVGGFHAAMKAFGGECVYAVEIDPRAAHVYEANWGHKALGDITETADDDRGIMQVPAHDVLCAGFPCQPFSKSGAQRGMDETRGTLFFNIASIIKAHHPSIVFLENVRNLAGPRHQHEWDVIIDTLRAEGYHVAERPAIFSPHLLPAAMGGAPQVRERVFITATYAPEFVCSSDYKGPEPVASMVDHFASTPTLDHVWNSSGPIEDSFEPKSHTRGWHLDDLLDDRHIIPGCELSDSEILWIDAWDDFVQKMRVLMGGRHLPGHPIWAESWLDFEELRNVDWRAEKPRFPRKVTRPLVPDGLPAWKKSHLERNYDLFAAHHREIIGWAHKWGIFTSDFPPSRRKLEWQAQDSLSLWDTVMHLRPSGIRAKKPTYLPALVAITQTSIIGPRKRRLSPRETARLQGLPDSFVFPDQPASATYRQMGNGVNVGAVWHVFRQHVIRDIDILSGAGFDVERLSSTHELRARVEAGRRIVRAVRRAPLRPNEILMGHRPASEGEVCEGSRRMFNGNFSEAEALGSRRAAGLKVRETA